MRRIIKFFLCISTIFFLFTNRVSASVPYITRTLSADGKLIETQTAYTPLGNLFSYIDIVSPEDIFIDQKGNIYLADSGAKKIIISNNLGTEIREVGSGELEIPTGVFVDENGHIYVADYGKSKVIVFSQNGEKIKEFGRPESPLFGKTSPYKPQKVAVDKRGNIYIIGEGSNNGIIQLSRNGDFLGYFGVNRTEVSLIGIIRDLISTDEQKARLFMKIPPAPNNIAIDNRGLLYTITKGTTYEVIKKLNIAGQNMFPSDISDDPNLVDITVDANGNIFIINADGKIFEYDSNGNLLFVFGGKDDGSNRLGLFKQPSGIAVDQSGHIYVADKEMGMVQVFEPTEFLSIVHEGLELYKEGLYVESQEYWEKVINLNSSFGLAHTAMGKAYFKQQDYEKALEEYLLAMDVEGYSEAFWEVRNIWLQNHLETILYIIILAVILWKILKFFDQRKNIFNPVRTFWSKCKSYKLVKDLLFLFRFIRHPIDSFYDMKRYGRGSILSATILYIILFVFYLIFRFQTGFIFSTVKGQETNLMIESAVVFVPVISFIIVNYLVSTINDGEGRLRDVYIGTVYSLVPIFIIILPVTLISHALTLNEAFIYEFSLTVMIAWSLTLLFIMIKEVHNFTISETIKNIIITIFGMLILWLVVVIIFVLINEVYNFVYSIFKEVMLRV